MANFLRPSSAEEEKVRQADAAVIKANELIGLTKLGLVYGIPRNSVSEWEKSSGSGMLRRMVTRSQSPFDSEKFPPARFTSLAYPNFVLHIGVDVSPAATPHELGGQAKGETSRVRYIFEPRKDAELFDGQKHLTGMHVVVDQGMLGAQITNISVGFQDGNRQGRYRYTPGRHPDFSFEVEGSNSGGMVSSQTLHPSGLMADLYGALIKQKLRVEEKIRTLIVAFDVGATNAARVLDQGEALTLREIIGLRRNANMDLRMTPEQEQQLLSEGLLQSVTEAAKVRREQGIVMQTNDVVRELRASGETIKTSPDSDGTKEKPFRVLDKHTAAFVRHIAEVRYNELVQKNIPDVEYEKRSWTNEYFEWDKNEEKLLDFSREMGLSTFADLFVHWKPVGLAPKVSLGWSLSDGNARGRMLDVYALLQKEGTPLIDFVRSSRMRKPSDYPWPLDWSQTVMRPGKEGNLTHLPEDLHRQGSIKFPDGVALMGVGSSMKVGAAEVTMATGIKRDKPKYEASYAACMLEPSINEIVNGVHFTEVESESNGHTAVLTLEHKTSKLEEDIECRIVFGPYGRLIEYRKVPDIWIGTPGDFRRRFPTLLPCIPEEVPENIRIVMQEIVDQVMGNHEDQIDVEFVATGRDDANHLNREIFAAKRDIERPKRAAKILMAHLLEVAKQK